MRGGLDKKNEFAAGCYGAVIAARAGYDPYGLLTVLQTLSSINPPDDAVALMFNTHPDPDERRSGIRSSAMAVSRTTPSVLPRSCTRT